ncbi:hypothetical protein DES53_11393 [Roseimicrobium gellanilyticum]|uniref:Uncharacterized protein n=1 Tax=Roseimicrobium gellanilyticum TaxID=748857 RepID=A0A366H8L8_9BACT|nr:hypothetical protein [Roseimicrobium gellanilyticum]RBP37711.1 hypothetical protein DES53_11393 [Roseimicrobium gellanilyticum]
MHRHPTRALPTALSALLLLLFLLGATLAIPTAALAQSGRRSVQPAQPVPPTPVRPATAIPARPVTITPAQPAVSNRATTIPSTSVIKPGGTKPVIPGVTYPVIKPTKPVITPPVVTGNRGVVLPSKPVKPVPLPHPVPHPHHPHPHYPVYPYYPQYPIVVIPSYPSAYIGPEIVSVTTYPTEDEGANVPSPAPPQGQGQGQMQPGDPAALQRDAATPRLIAILGRIERVETSLPLGSTGAGVVVTQATGRDGDQLCIGVATLTTYYNPDPDHPPEAMARGTYFGSRWDGDTWHTSATGLWSRGPVTRQPIFTLHEVLPSAFPFEVARPGHRITSLRMAIALASDSSSSSPATASRASTTSTLPSQKRHLTMAASLRRRLQESTEPVPLTPSPDHLAPAPALAPGSPSETYLGNAHSPFGQALADSLQELLTTASLPQPSVSGYQPSTKNHQPAAGLQLLGSAEWTLPLTDLRDIMTGCPRFTTIPLPADLQTVRTRDTSPSPVWVRPFRIEVPAQSEASSGHQPSTLNHQPAATYQGEVWFLIVPDGALRG